jgi:hypothetical protein
LRGVAGSFSSSSSSWPGLLLLATKLLLLSSFFAPDFVRARQQISAQPSLLPVLVVVASLAMLVWLHSAAV